MGQDKLDRREVLVAMTGFSATALGGAALAQRRGVMLMDRVGPTGAQLYIANADGSGERRLLTDAPGLDYHASFFAHGRRLLFTSERRGRGQADIYSARLDGSGLAPLIASPAVEDAAVVSPDGRRIAFVSTRQGGKANVWVLDRRTGKAVNLTGRGGFQGDPDKPDGFFRPAWSPDGRWLAFSSDRNTAWKGHDCSAQQGSTSCAGAGEGWEQVQQLSLYIARADGEGFRRIAGRPGYSAGSPKWSKDGKRVVFYEASVQDTWNGRIAFLVAHAASQIVSVDVATGERTEHTTGPGLKLFPQFLGADEIGYMVKGGDGEGLYFTSGRPGVKGHVRSPAWSPDASKVVYEKLSFDKLPQNTPLYSWDPAYAYRSTDSFPGLSRDGKLVITEQQSNSSVAVLDPDGSNRVRVFDTQGKGLAFGPCWSPDGQWVVFGFGLYFENRFKGPTKIMRVRRDGTGLETLYEGPQNAGFPSCAPDGRQVVFRLVGADGTGGLQILDLQTRALRVLTTDYDNLPAWSPDGSRIVFSRRLGDGNFDIFTIRPDGSDLKRLTTSGANDAHATWTADGRILWNSGFYGFKDEAPLYDNNFQPYGQIWIMNADGSGKRALTDSLWEDSQPLYIPARFLGGPHSP
ncbi:MAG TPA: hypothetical protein VMU59_03595 [Caulobacteraceae bacterium]|nr:hypothetical protein [Caulobacteraceae bacterium]